MRTILNLNDFINTEMKLVGDEGGWGPIPMMILMIVMVKRHL